MPVSCCVVGCARRAGYKNEKGQNIGFFRFPSSPTYDERRQAWISAVNRKNWIPSKWDRVCGHHFVSGRSVPELNHPDWAPSLHLDGDNPNCSGNERSRLDRFLRTQKRSALQEIENILPGDIEIEHLDNDIVKDNMEPAKGSGQTNLDILCEVASKEKQNSDAMENGVLLKNINTLRSENEQLESENRAFVQAVHLLNKETKVVTDFEKQENRVVFYTGLPNLTTFNSILNYILSSWKPTCRSGLTYQEQLLLTLMKLRLGLLGQDLAFRFGISVDKVSSIFQEWITILAQELKPLICWPDSNRKPKIPLPFRNTPFQKTKCIIDCTEIFIEKPNAFTARSQTWSDYKGHNTVKFLVAVNMAGAITFLSKCWGGRVSDKELTLKCGFLDLLKPGDVVMADRGFNIAEILATRGVTLKIPPFTKGKDQLSRQEVEEARQLSRVRIHVERAIGRMKIFRIIQTTLPISLVKNGKSSTVDKIIIVCASLANLKPPLVK